MNCCSRLKLSFREIMRLFQFLNFKFFTRLEEDKKRQLKKMQENKELLQQRLGEQGVNRATDELNKPTDDADHINNNFDANIPPLNTQHSNHEKTNPRDVSRNFWGFHDEWPDQSTTSYEQKLAQHNRTRKQLEQQKQAQELSRLTQQALRYVKY